MQHASLPPCAVLSRLIERSGPAMANLLDDSMFIPVDDDRHGFSQTVWKIEKTEGGEVKRKRLFGVRYVPLTDAPKPPQAS